MPYSSTLVTLEAPLPVHLNLSIRRNNVQTLFTTQATYTNYRQTVKFESSLKYYHILNTGPLPPTLKLVWDNDATSIGDMPASTASTLMNKDTRYPFSYSMLANIMTT
jgi:hypothetical protein